MSSPQPISRDSNKFNLSRSINRSMILELVRSSKRISRTQIAQKLGISLPTVMRVVDELMADDWIQFYGLSESTGGRPPTLIELSSRNNIVIGVDLGGTEMFGAVADLGGKIQQELSVDCRKGGSEDNVQSLIGLIERMLNEPRQPGQKVRGIGVGVPGITLTTDGAVAFAPSLGWHDLPLKQILMEHFDLPVFVDNDVNMAALGELGYGAGRGYRNLVTITVGTGIGAGIIIDGALYRGRNQAAGEIGYMLPGIDFLGKRYTNQFGAFENMASETGITERARKILESLDLPPTPDKITSESVFEAAFKGEPWAQQVLDETINYLSVVIGNISTLLDPDKIILGGGISRYADYLIETILNRLNGSLLYPPPLVASSLGYRATVMGAIMLILNITTEQVVLKYLQ